MGIFDFVSSLHGAATTKNLDKNYKYLPQKGKDIYDFLSKSSGSKKIPKVKTIGRKEKPHEPLVHYTIKLGDNVKNEVFKNKLEKKLNALGLKDKAKIIFDKANRTFVVGLLWSDIREKHWFEKGWQS